MQHQKVFEPIVSLESNDLENAELVHARAKLRTQHVFVTNYSFYYGNFRRWPSWAIRVISVDFRKLLQILGCLKEHT